MDIFQGLGSIHDYEKPHEHVGFSLNYFGVRKHKTDYLLVNKDADWISKSGHEKFLGWDGTFDRSRLVSAIESHWQLELLSVGIKVL